VDKRVRKQTGSRQPSATSARRARCTAIQARLQKRHDVSPRQTDPFAFASPARRNASAIAHWRAAHRCNSNSNFRSGSVLPSALLFFAPAPVASSRTADENVSSARSFFRRSTCSASSTLTARSCPRSENRRILVWRPPFVRSARTPFQAPPEYTALPKCLCRSSQGFPRKTSYVHS